MEIYVRTNSYMKIMGLGNCPSQPAYARGMVRTDSLSNGQPWVRTLFSLRDVLVFAKVEHGNGRLV